MTFLHMQCKTLNVKLEKKCFWSGIVQEIETKPPAMQLLYFNMKLCPQCNGWNPWESHD